MTNTQTQIIKQQLKKGLLELIQKYSSNAEQQRHIYLLLQEVLKEGLY
jgi:HSP90 family molecular chaperone